MFVTAATAVSTTADASGGAMKVMSGCVTVSSFSIATDVVEVVLAASNKTPGSRLLKVVDKNNDESGIIFLGATFRPRQHPHEKAL